METTNQQERLNKLRAYAQSNMPVLAYHNFRHVETVVNAAREFGLLEGLSSKDIFILQSAAYLHDIIYVVGAKDNEERSAAVSANLLSTLGYSPDQIVTASKLILATKLPTSPSTQLERVICDADLSNLGKEDFFPENEALKHEFGAKDDYSWYLRSYDFLNNHKYYTNAALQLREEGRRKNLDRLKEILIGFPR